MARLGEMVQNYVSGAKSRFSHPEPNFKVIQGAIQPLPHPKLGPPNRVSVSMDLPCACQGGVSVLPVLCAIHYLTEPKSLADA